MKVTVPHFKKKKTKWHKWFAWYPVNPCGTWDILWLETVLRAYVEPMGYGHYGNWDYKKIK